MKKLIIALSCLAMTAGFVSCKKDYTCTCRESGSDAFVFEINNSRRPEASLLCNASDTYYDDGCDLD